MLLSKADAIKADIKSKVYNLDVTVVNLNLKTSSGEFRAKLEVRIPTMGKYTLEVITNSVQKINKYYSVNFSVEGQNILISFE